MEPRTRSGRAHADHLGSVSRSPYSGVSFPDADGTVTAIEREARAALLDELEAAVRERTERHDSTHTCSSERVHADLRACLALIQQHREGNP